LVGDVDDDAVSGVSVGKQQQTKESIFSNIFFFFFCSNNKQMKENIFNHFSNLKSKYMLLYIYIFHFFLHMRESRLTIGETKKKLDYTQKNKYKTMNINNKITLM